MTYRLRILFCVVGGVALTSERAAVADPFKCFPVPQFLALPFNHCDLLPATPNGHSVDLTVTADGTLLAAWVHVGTSADTVYVARLDHLAPSPPYWRVLSGTTHANSRFAELSITSATGFTGQGVLWPKAYHVATRRTQTPTGKHLEKVVMFSGPYDYVPPTLEPAPRVAVANMEHVNPLGTIWETKNGQQIPKFSPKRRKCEWQLDTEVVARPNGKYAVAVAFRYPETRSVMRPGSPTPEEAPSDSIFIIYSHNYGATFLPPDPDPQNPERPDFRRIAGLDDAVAVNWLNITPADVLWGQVSEDPDLFRSPYAVFSQPRLIYNASTEILGVAFGGFDWEEVEELTYWPRARAWVTHSDPGPSNLNFFDAGGQGWFGAQTPVETPCTHPTLVRHRFGDVPVLDLVCVTSQEPDTATDFAHNPNMCDWSLAGPVVNGTPTGVNHQQIILSTWDWYFDDPLYENPSPLVWFKFEPPGPPSSGYPPFLYDEDARLDWSNFQVISPPRASSRGLYGALPNSLSSKTFITAEVPDPTLPQNSRIALARAQFRPNGNLDVAQIIDDQPLANGRRFRRGQPALGVNVNPDLTPTLNSVGWFRVLTNGAMTGMAVDP